LSLDLEKIGSGGIGKRAKDFPTLHDDNIDKILGQFDQVDVAITSQQGTVTGIEDRVSAIEEGLYNSQTQIIVISAGYAETSYVNSISAYLQTQITNNTTDIVTISAELGTMRDQVLTIVEASLSGGFRLGLPQDGTFSDGAVTNITADTLIADAIDYINEYLLSMSPSVPSLHGTQLSRNTGEIGKLSFGLSNQLVGYVNAVSDNTNDLFTNTGNKAGIFDRNTHITGILAYGTSGNGFENNAFSDGDKGTLRLFVNGFEVGSVDLASSSNAIGYGAGSGFSVSELKYAVFESGKVSSVPYRTGNYRVVPSDLYDGSNTIQVKHDIVGQTLRVSQSFEIIVDDNTESMTITQSLSGLSMGVEVQLSGVKYHTTGSLNYTASISGAYKNTYSISSITHPVATRLSSAPTAMFPGVITNSSDAVNLNQAISIDTTQRILGQGVAINTFVPRTLGRSLTFATLSSYSLLVDPFTNTGSTNTTEDFNSEKYRMYNGAGITTNTSYSSGPSGSPFTWISSNNMHPSGGFNLANEVNGLLFYDGTLRSPKQGLNGGNFSSVANGPTFNANYSTGMGSILTFYRYFYFGGTYANFTLNISATNTLFGDNTGVGSPSGNTIKVEAMIPGSGTGYGTWYDCRATQSNGGIYGTTYGANPPTNWGLSFPGSNTAITKAILLKISADINWIGYISSISISGISQA
jgi:hypothetical protein